MKELSEIQFEEISENIGVSIEYLEDIQKFTLYTFKELRADHDEIKKLLFHLIETAERSVPKILVDGGFKAGDVSGQIIVGENNIQYKDCTFTLPDGSTMHGKSWIYTEGVRPATDPANVFGRRQELGRIDEILKHSQALAITGFRGTGKSTLASMYIDRIEKREGFAGIYWRKVDETIDISDVVGSFFTCMGKKIEDPGRYKVGDLLNLFFKELNAAPYFLVLDNFEILLDPQNNKPLKPGFSDLIEKANEGFGRSRVLFTSWECPASERGIRPTRYPIGGLDDSAAIQLLRQRGLTEPDDELRKAVDLSGGHPLALILLVQLVKDGDETLSDILSDDTLWRGEVAANILDKVYKDRLNEEERKLLQYVSLYRMPVPARAIAAAANDPDWTEAKVKKTATSLKRKSMLEKTGKNYWEESLIDNYAYNKLVDRVKRHKLACQYYLDLPLPEKRTTKEDVQSLIEAHHHACMAEEYDRAGGIIFDHNLHEDLDRWSNYRTLVELYAGVLPKDHFRDEPLLGSLKTHGDVLGNLGNVYSALGQVEKAIKYYEDALVISREIGDRRGEGADLGNLGRAYSDLGQVEKAIKYYEDALVISREVGDRRGEGNHLGNLGNAYYALGQVEKAIEYHEDALVISREIGDRRGEGNTLGNLGNAYYALGQVEKAIEYHEDALVISREIGDRRGEGADLGNLGLAYSALGQVEKAIECYEDALVIAKEIGDRRNEGVWLGNLGSAYYALGQVEKAIEYHEDALVISREIGDRRGEGADLGNLGLAYSALGQVEKAIEYYEDALVIAREIGDRRGEGADLGNLGNAYRNLGQVEKATEYYENALTIGKEIKDPRIIDFCEKNLISLKNSGD
uniref:Photosystem I assembly protein Ycf3 n=1 Tax=Candidatus Methanogaster sp. ANME-2c ERB4 TaxID=2759911 RepID=A0A7G9YGF0_9EURY|nr:photosystem I assembly protein Ycf3 [Methanosarcinales archaeon ANME-2c ERB4]